MSEERDLIELQRLIATGLDIKMFMGTAPGRVIQQRANDEIEAALEALKTVDPEDAKAVRKLQNDVAVAERVLSWLGEAVSIGEQAERQFEAEG